jgi:hypothetical protein
VIGKLVSEEMMPCVVLTPKLLGLYMEIRGKGKWKVSAEGHRDGTKRNRQLFDKLQLQIRKFWPHRIKNVPSVPECVIQISVKYDRQCILGPFGNMGLQKECLRYLVEERKPESRTRSNN